MIPFHAGLDPAELERKIRLLTLESLTSTQVGKAVPYAQIANALQVPEQDVEKWVIQGAWTGDFIV
jgi:translation initiation factor 3 subunit M